MINEIGKSVLEMACREAVSWAVPARISVNVSPFS
jgi:predicted signal transduction protein with EAL and GGDEF domain